MKKAFWFLFYNIFLIPIQYLGFHTLGLFNKKVRRGIAGRKQIFQTIQRFNERRDQRKPLFIIHCASLGEYEMAEPVICELKHQRGDLQIALTFFSPSGYEQVNDSSQADMVTYLPFDSMKKVSEFFGMLSPDKLILTSYEAWPNLIWTASRFGIETYIISARMQSKNAKSFPFVKSFYSTIYNSIEHIYTITAEDEHNFISYFDLNKDVDIKTLGNTRYDRVIARAMKTKDTHLLPKNFQSGNTIVGGSLWPPDNEVILPALSRLVSDLPDLKFVFAPHEPDTEHLNELQAWCEANHLKYIKFTELQDNNFEERVILIDTIGVLAEIYHDCDIAFIGGGFSGSVHNVMEPAVAGCTVFFGPDHHNSNEAEQLTVSGGGFSVQTTDGFENIIRELLFDDKKLRQAQNAAGNVILKNKGATITTVKKILN